MTLFRQFASATSLCAVFGCTLTSSQNGQTPVQLSLCVIDLSLGPPPTRGSPAIKCKEKVAFSAIALQNSGNDGPGFTFHVVEQDKATLKAFQAHNIRSTAVLSSHGKAVANLMIMSGEYLPIELPLDSQEIEEVEKLL